MKNLSRRNWRTLGLALLVATLAWSQLSFAENRPSLIEALGTKSQKRTERVSVIPMFGYGNQTGDYSDFLHGQWAVGVAVDLPVTRLFSVEIEGGYENHEVQDFTLSTLHRVLFGANLKIAPRFGFFRPYLGGGGLVIYNDHRRFDSTRYARWMGAGQLMLGADVFLTRRVGIGLRATYVIPLINRPPQFTFPSSADAIISSNHFRVLGTLTLSF